MRMGRIETIVFFILFSFIFFPVIGACGETGSLPVTLLLRDGSLITRALPDPPIPPKGSNISVRDAFVTWKDLNIEGVVYTHDGGKFTLDMDQMIRGFLSIELVDSNLRPYQNGTIIIENVSGEKITATNATLLAYIGHPDGVSDILALEFDGYNQFFREIFIGIEDVQIIRFDKEKRSLQSKKKSVAGKKKSSPSSASSSRFASSSQEIRDALIRKGSSKGSDGSVNLNVLFDPNSHVIRKTSIPLLKELGKALISRELKEKSILIRGHTDSDGSDSFNQELSLKRARAVRTFLVAKFGISPKKLVTAGYGEANPLVPNIGKSNKQKNRRVEIRLAGE